MPKTFARVNCVVSYCTLAVLSLIAFATPARAATAGAVDDALEKGKAYLYSLQKNGTWEESPTPPAKAITPQTAQSVTGGQWTGPTALAVYALLAVGENPQNPKLVKAIEFLTKSETVGVYALSMRMQVWLHLPRKPEYLAAAKRDVGILLRSVKSSGTAAGMFDYVPTLNTYSHSRSQYGVLGVWAADQMGIETPGRFWEMVEAGWISHQAPDGGWTYKLPKETEIAETPGMTAVGIATLFITQDYTHFSEGLACKGNLANASIERGLKWMGDHMNLVATDKSYARDFPYITLYAVERIGVAAGLKYINGVDWYKKGSEWLLAKQGKTGAWSGGGLGGNLVDTSYAMLFLSSGRAPIAFSKLDYSRGQAGPQAPPWNQRPRDLANVTRWIGHTVERNLAWQVVPTSAPLADIAGAPVLYIAGNKALAFDEADKEKLRAFIEAGGMIVANTDCTGQAFTTSYRKLAEELFPHYEMRELPVDHPLYTGVFRRAKWKIKPVIFGVSNGVRELMLLIPQNDPSRVWQSRMVGGREEFWELAAAIFLYVSEGKDLRYRGETHLVEPDKKVIATRTVAVHRLQLPINWNPEPGGWRRIANIVHNENRIDLKIDTVKLGTEALPAGGVAHLTGTDKFVLTSQQRDQLKQFVTAGGTLLVDAAGGAPAFAASAESELSQIFTGSPLDILPEDHPLYSPGGKKIGPVHYRKLAQQTATGHLRVPRLRGILLNGRVAVLFSREDLSAGIVGQSVEGINGYEPDSATELVAAVLAYVAGPEKATTRPTTQATTQPTTPATTKPAHHSKKPAKPAN